MLDKTVWENRHTTRLFSEENTSIPKDDLKYLETVINNIPSQCSIKSHFWIYLGQSAEDMELRTWLADNVFWIMQKDDTVKEHMLGVIQAPAILLSVACNEPWANTEPGKSKADHKELMIRSEGFHAGVILATLLNMNYNVATFGCTSGLHNVGEKEETEKKEAFNKMIRDRYANELQKLIDKYPGDTGNWDDIEFWPSISTCFGPEAIDKNYTLIVEKYETWTSASGKDYHFYNGNKTRTPIASCIGFRRNYE